MSKSVLTRQLSRSTTNGGSPEASARTSLLVSIGSPGCGSGVNKVVSFRGIVGQGDWQNLKVWCAAGVYHFAFLHFRLVGGF
jgi:hypothetical protein